MVEFNVIWTCSARSGTISSPATTAAACLCRLGRHRRRRRCLSRSSPRGSFYYNAIQYYLCGNCAIEISDIDVIILLNALQFIAFIFDF